MIWKTGFTIWRPSERKTWLIYVLWKKRLSFWKEGVTTSSLECRNIPCKKDETQEDLCNLVINIGKVLDVPVEKEEIRDVYRTTTKTTSDKPLIVDFTTVIKKDNILSSLKKINKKNSKIKLTAASLSLGGPPKPVFISENLTHRSRRLFFAARNHAKTHDYAYCWTTNGKIYLRKREGMPALRISTESELVK